MRYCLQRYYPHILILSIIAFVCTCALKAQSQMLQKSNKNTRIKFASDSILVRFKTNILTKNMTLARTLVGGKKLKGYKIVPGLEHIKITGIDVEKAIEKLSNLPFIEYAEPDYFIQSDPGEPTPLIPNDTYFDLQWGLHNTGQTIPPDQPANEGVPDADIDAPEAWTISTGDPNTVIAILDTGIQMEHPDLAANIWVNPNEIPDNGIDDDDNGYVDDVNGWDFFEGDNDPSPWNRPWLPDEYHGTHVAGIIGAVGDNEEGVTGVLWNCKLMPLRMMGPNGGYTSYAVKAIDYAVMMGVKVSNNSWSGGHTQALYDAIEASQSIGHLFIAAAGNSNGDNDLQPVYPSSYDLDNIISVAATDNKDNMASFSCYGETSVDIGAPGVYVGSTCPTYLNKGFPPYIYLSGTSMATPHVAGVAALVYAQHPDRSYQEIKDVILNTVRPIPSLDGKTVTGGLVNAYNALQYEFPIPEDINNDGVVNILDLVVISIHFGRQVNDGLEPAWTSIGDGSIPDQADVNDDGVVNILDMVRVSIAFD